MLLAYAHSTLTRGPITHKMVGDLPEASDPAEASANQLDASGLAADADSTLTRGPITHKMVGDLPEGDSDPAESAANQLDSQGVVLGSDSTLTRGPITHKMADEDLLKDPKPVPSSRIGRIRVNLSNRLNKLRGKSS